MEEIMSLHGTPLSLHLPPSSLSSRRTATTAAAGVQYMASHTSMHHFCTGIYGFVNSFHIQDRFGLCAKHFCLRKQPIPQLKPYVTKLSTEPLSAELPAAIQAQQRLSISRGSHELSCDPSHDQAGRSHDSGGSATDQSGGVWTAAGKRLEIAQTPTKSVTSLTCAWLSWCLFLACYGNQSLPN